MIDCICVVKKVKEQLQIDAQQQINMMSEIICQLNIINTHMKVKAHNQSIITDTSMLNTYDDYDYSLQYFNESHSNQVSTTAGISLKFKGNHSEIQIFMRQYTLYFNLHESQN